MSSKLPLNENWKLPVLLGVPWRLADGTLTIEAQRIIRAYNDLGYVPNIAKDGTIKNVRFKTARPEFDEEG